MICTGASSAESVTFFFLRAGGCKDVVTGVSSMRLPDEVGESLTSPLPSAKEARSVLFEGDADASTPFAGSAAPAGEGDFTSLLTGERELDASAF